MKINRLVLMALLSLALSLFIPISSIAVHKGAGELVCGNCHTMHSSQGGTNGLSMGGPTGSFILLRSGNSSISSRAEIHKLCLQCHADNGSQNNGVFKPHDRSAPKVYLNSGWTQNDPFNRIGAGGNFYTELNGGWDVVTPVTLGYGHSLGASSSVIPPGGEQAIGGDGFSCTNCHDPHGTDNDSDTKTNRFRNLKVFATGSGTTGGVKFYNINAATQPYYWMKSYVGGVTGTFTSSGNYTPVNAGSGDEDSGATTAAIWPVYKGSTNLSGNPPDDNSRSNSYATGTDDCNGACYFGNSKVTMSIWCAQCHDKWHEDIETGNFVGFEPASPGYLKGIGPDWNRHPVNGMMSRDSAAGCATGCHTSLNDRATYSISLIQAGKGLPVTASGYYINNAYYLPTCAYPGSGDCMGGMDTGQGGVNGANHKVFCLSCHFAHAGPYFDNLRWNYTSAVSSGSQSGNGVPSNVGCQLCHNR